MKRRLTIARGLINEPDMMLLDEPTTGLDPQARHLVWDRLYRLKRQGVTLILTTHYMDEAEQLCDRLVVMDKARIVAEGSPRSLIEPHSSREVLELRFDDGATPDLARPARRPRRARRAPARPPAPLRRRRRGHRRGHPRPGHPPGQPAGAPLIARGRLPAPHGPEPRRVSVRGRRRAPCCASSSTTSSSTGAPGAARSSRPSSAPSSSWPPSASAWARSSTTPTPSGIEGVGYLAFLAPGLLVAQAMQTAAFESTYPVMAGIRWLKTYVAMILSPLDARHVATGQLLWTGLRVTFGARHLRGRHGRLRGHRAGSCACCCCRSRLLTGLAFAAPIQAFAATQKNDSAFASLFRFVIMPMFIFRGTFFPITQLPELLQVVAYLTPLWHAVALARGIALDVARPAPGGRQRGLPLGLRGRRPVWPRTAPSAGSWRSSRAHHDPALPDPAAGPLARPQGARARRARLPAQLVDHRLGLLRAGLLPAGHRLRAGHARRRRGRHPLRGLRGARAHGHHGHERGAHGVDLQPLLQAEVRQDVRRHPVHAAGPVRRRRRAR